MTQPSHSAGGSLPAGPAPGTAAGSRTVGGTGPGVPLSVWPGLPVPRIRDSGPCGGRITTAAARRVIDVFSRPGDLVAAGGGSPEVIEAAAAAGRAILTLVPGGPALAPAPDSAATGQAALAIAGCCSPGCCASPETGSQEDLDAGLLYAASERVLRSGGILAVITGHATSSGSFTGTAGNVVAAARAAGLVYVQHIVLIHAEIDGDRLDPAELTPAGPVGDAGVHSDLLVFAKPGRPVSPQGGLRP